MSVHWLLAALWCFPGAGAAGEAGPASVAVSGPEVLTRKVISFEGFSADGQVSAWAVKFLMERDDGITDEFAIVRLVDNATRELKGQYRLTPQIMRTIQTPGDVGLQRGRVGQARAVVPVNQDDLARQYPQWGSAGAVDAWRDFKKRARLSSRPVRFDRGVIRIHPEGAGADAATLRINYAKTSAKVEAWEGRELKFLVTAVLPDGRELELGRFGLPAPMAGSLRAVVAAYQSATNSYVAVLCRFFVGASTQELISMGTVREAPGFGATLGLPGGRGRGTVQRIEDESNKIYMELFPSSDQRMEYLLKN